MFSRTIAGRAVSAIGLGAMPMSLKGRPDEAQSLRTIHAALDAGVRLIDTADAYCIDASEVGHNEALVARALATWHGDASEVLVATKGGHTRTAGGEWGLDGRPAYLRQACEASLKALGANTIGLYQFHRPDPKVPTDESVGALADLQAEGKVVLVGVSNFNVTQIESARRIVDLASVQNQYSPAFRSSQAELEYCAQHGIAFLPWSPLGGMSRAAELGSRHAAFAEVARERGVSAQRVALAWELAQAPNVIPIPGARRPETILDSLAATELLLSDEELQRLGAVR